MNSAELTGLIRLTTMKKIKRSEFKAIKTLPKVKTIRRDIKKIAKQTGRRVSNSRKRKSSTHPYPDKRLTEAITSSLASRFLIVKQLKRKRYVNAGK